MSLSTEAFLHKKPVSAGHAMTPAALSIMTTEKLHKVETAKTSVQMVADLKEHVMQHLQLREWTNLQKM
jgi:hypothetical protein